MNLLARAKLVGQAQATNRGRYWWISKQDVLLLNPARNKARFKLHRLDLATGRQTALDAFNRKHGARVIGEKWRVSTYGVPGFKVEYWTPRCSVSPDGKWFLWLSGGTTWIAASLDGAMEREWAERHSIPASCCWLRDSEKWVQLVSQYKKGVYTLGKAILRSVTRRSAPETTALQVADGLVLGVTSRGSILIHHAGPTQTTAEIALSEVSLTPGRPSRRHSISLPEPGELSGLTLSKSGDRLAWIESGPRQSLPEVYSLWVGGLDGRNIEEVGRMRGQIEQAAPRGQRQHYWPRSLRWLPDEDEISFVFKEDLYRLRVP